MVLVGKLHINPKSCFPFEYLDGIEHNYSDTKEMPAKDVVIRNPLLKKFIEECTGSDIPFCVIAASYDQHGPYTAAWNAAFNARGFIGISAGSGAWVGIYLITK